MRQGVIICGLILLAVLLVQHNIVAIRGILGIRTSMERETMARHVKEYAEQKVRYMLSQSNSVSLPVGETVCDNMPACNDYFSLLKGELERQIGKPYRALRGTRSANKGSVYLYWKYGEHGEYRISLIKRGVANQTYPYIEYQVRRWQEPPKQSQL